MICSKPRFVFCLVLPLCHRRNRLRAIEQDPKLKFADFARGLFAFADTHAIDRVIIDLRFNGGGDSRLIGALKSGLKSRAALGSHVLVLVGSGTFSSALMNAIELRDELHATLVGEAPGERPNSYGEVKFFTLPNSQLHVQYCTKFFRQVKSGNPAELEPDIPAAPTLGDTLSGRDPVLEAALRADLASLVH